DLVEVVVEGAVGDEFDVVQAEELSAVVVDAAVAGGDVDDRLEAEGLPDGAAPAGVEGPADLVLGVGRRGAGQPERVRRLDAAELDTQIGHDSLQTDSPRRAAEGRGGRIKTKISI